MTYALYARKGWGSAITEAALTCAEVDFELLGARGDPSKGFPPLKEANPLGQWPTLLCADGTVMTETAAILFHLDDVAPKAGLVPPKRARERRAFLRWLQVIVGAIYPTFTYADYPGRYVSAKVAQKELVDNIAQRRKTIWIQIEGELQPSPWFLGARFSGLDIYAAVMTRWGPRRKWFAAHCPKLMSVAKQADAIPALVPIWKRNFGR